MLTEKKLVSDFIQKGQISKVNRIINREKFTKNDILWFCRVIPETEEWDETWNMFERKYIKVVESVMYITTFHTEENKWKLAVYTAGNKQRGRPKKKTV